MFSGIVEELGSVRDNAIANRGRLVISAAGVIDGAALGDSVAVNGCCLTIVEQGDGWFAADVMPESGRRTNLGQLQSGDRVNLEAALRLGDRVGGHLVSGHVDGVGEIVELSDDGNAVWARIAAPEMTRYMVEKGSIAADGISLTVVDVEPGSFTVSLIPHTVAATTASRWAQGTKVNLEADLVAKHVARTVLLQLGRQLPAARADF